MDVAVVGAGPVGLFLGLALAREGLDVGVFERRPERRGGSRSIGVHPPSLELLDELGLADRFVARGVRVERGHAFDERGPCGVIEFARCPGRHRYVLAIPQEETEDILRGALEERAPGALRTGAFVGVDERRGEVALRVRTPDGERVEHRARVLVGCDGKHSAVRTALGIAYDGAPYPGCYTMGDFPDGTTFGADAAVYLGRDGLVESFPLPGGSRRWVARCPDDRDPDLGALVARVEGRTGHRLDPSTAVRPSAFRAERYLARELARGRIALAGDAAHVVSPIGGQGMNLGWLGARSLAATIATSLRKEGDPTRALAADGARRARLARATARRAELNMWLGRPVADAAPRDRLVRGLLRPPVSDLVARVFTMRGLALGV